jgi:hypothetical protein
MMEISGVLDTTRVQSCKSPQWCSFLSMFIKVISLIFEFFRFLVFCSEKVRFIVVKNKKEKLMVLNER